MTNILFIAYEFPPLNSGGVYRSLAFVKYLKQFGINPIVITLAQKCFHNAFENYTIDEQLGKDILSGIDVVEIASKNINSLHKSRVNNFVDIYFNIMGKEANGWDKDFKKILPGIVERYKPQAIFVTLPPFSILKQAVWLSKLSKLPLITDFRDAWSQWRLAPYGSYFHYLATLKAERKYFKYADAIIATSNQTVSDFKRLHAGIDANKFHLITNGFDDEISIWKTEFPQKDNYVIGYVGSFYYDKAATEMMLMPWRKKKLHRKLQYISVKQNWLYRSPYFFFKALRILFDKHPGYEKTLRVKFAGKKPDWLFEMIKEFRLEENVELLGVLSHSDSIRFQETCDALLITSSKVIGGSDYSIAGKTFEYFKIQKPIIAFVSEGAQKEILEQSGTAVICDPDNSENAADNIFQLFEHKVNLIPDNNFLTSLSRKKLTEKLSAVIHDTINNGKHS